MVRFSVVSAQEPLDRAVSSVLARAAFVRAEEGFVMKSTDNAVRAIRAASTESQVLQAVSDYLKSLEPSAFALLPAELTAIGLSHAEEVIHSALQLARSRMARSPKARTGERTFADVVFVLSTAARRLATLASKGPARSKPAKRPTQSPSEKVKRQRRRP
jgi:hypothetical protein